MTVIVFVDVNLLNTFLSCWNVLIFCSNWICYCSFSTPCAWCFLHSRQLRTFRSFSWH